MCPPASLCLLFPTEDGSQNLQPLWYSTDCAASPCQTSGILLKVTALIHTSGFNSQDPGMKANTLLPVQYIKMLMLQKEIRLEGSGFTDSFKSNIK